MAKSPTEQIRELTTELRVQEARLNALQTERAEWQAADEKQQKAIAGLQASHDKTEDALHQLTVELRVLAEREAARDKELSRLRTELDEERRVRIALEKENATLRQQFQDHLTQYQETDRRRWGLMGLFIGAILSLGSGLVVALVKK